MTEYLTAAGSLLMNGPTGILVSLGFEYMADMTLTQAYMYYNYVWVAITFFIAAMAGARSESRFLIVLPIMAAIFYMFGWVHTVNNTTFIVFLIITFLLGVFSYMNDVNHEKYGVAGPGSKLLAIVFIIVFFQAAVGVINGFNAGNLLFPAGNAQATPNVCNVGYQCDAFGNIDLTQSVATVGDTGGLFQSAVSLLNNLPMLALGILRMVVTILASVLLFSVVLNASISAIVPGVTSNAIYLVFLGLMQVGIWALYLYTIFQWYYKPTIGEGSL